MSRKSDDSVVGLLAVLLMVIFVMPFAGAYLAVGGNTEDEKTWGLIIAVVGIIIWLIIGFGASAY